MSKHAKIVIWCGAAANQKALANKIAAEFDVAGIIIDKKLTAKKTPFFKKFIQALQDRLFFGEILKAWTSLQERYSKHYTGWPNVPVLSVDSINTEEAFEFTKNLDPQLIVVSGTGLVKKKMLSIQPAIGIINLHTGLSPYIKGGPNCTNWCISTGQFNKIGNTIMWINEGIDSGNIISSELTPIKGNPELREIHWQVMEHAHDLYLRVIRYLLDHKPPYTSVQQKEIAPGKLYLTKMWNYPAKKALLKNSKTFKSGASSQPNEEIVVTVPLKN